MNLVVGQQPVPQFAILGPLEVHGWNGPSTPGAHKLRTLLAVLLVRANTVLSVDTLLEELWGTHTPPTALRVLRVYISQLRKLLAGGGRNGSGCTIVTQPPGYRLQVNPETVDAEQFERWCERGRQARTDGRAEEAAEEYRRALVLWRGPALADVRTGPIVASAAMRLDEARIAALEGRIDADLCLGRHRDVVSELWELVAEHPMHEGLHARLIVALYYAGRTTDALAVYQAVRRTLREELALEPGPELQRIHQAVLRADRLVHVPQNDDPLIGGGYRQFRWIHCRVHA